MFEKRNLNVYIYIYIANDLEDIFLKIYTKIFYIKSLLKRKGVIYYIHIKNLNFRRRVCTPLSLRRSTHTFNRVFLFSTVNIF